MSRAAVKTYFVSYSCDDNSIFKATEMLSLHQNLKYKRENTFIMLSEYMCIVACNLIEIA